MYCTPSRFAEEIKHRKFTNGHTDAVVVQALFERIFPELAKHDTLIVRAWEDSDVCSFMESLPELTGMQKLYIVNTVWFAL